MESDRVNIWRMSQFLMFEVLLPVHAHSPFPVSPGLLTRDLKTFQASMHYSLKTSALSAVPAFLLVTLLLALVVVGE